MAQWAKLFDVDGEQALFFLEPDGDDMHLHQVVNKDDIFMDVKLTFPNDVKDNSRKAFDALDQQSAINLLKMRDNLINGSPITEGVTHEADDKPTAAPPRKRCCGRDEPGASGRARKLDR